MRRCCWCCGSLQKGVVAIGVLGMLCAMVLIVLYGTVAVTLEEHLRTCRQDPNSEDNGVLPPCTDMMNPTVVLGVRIFLYIQVSVWVLFLVFSIILIIGAVKKRRSLLVPWMVLSGVVMAAVIWSGVNAVLYNRKLDLLASVLSLIIFSYCCLVIRSFSKAIKREALIPVLVPSTFTQPQMFCENNHTQVGEMRELPPAYTPNPTTPTKKSPLPTGLGVKI
ncbi:uncharacterized protein LOC121854112 [Homarus americanus]|uniref:uncharacterized protein LOC121854112 n=1 Tax=Homarus americanus TaxID=6706 RepID=UPI001C44A3A8|nr:uncharacterized protein LOC121854112 [Homarus americanus]